MDIRPNRHNIDSSNNDNGSDMKTIGNIIVALGLVFFAVLVAGFGFSTVNSITEHSNYVWAMYVMSIVTFAFSIWLLRLALQQVQAPKPDQEATPVDLKSKKTSPSTLG